LPVSLAYSSRADSKRTEKLEDSSPDWSPILQVARKCGLEGKLVGYEEMMGR
jgi:hypothetical protein